MLERSRTSLLLYQQLMERIRAHIRDHGLQPGDLLPNESRLQAQYGVSRYTVRKALDELQIEGIVERRQGLGTFVATPRMENRLPELTSFTEDIQRKGLRPGSRLLRLETVNDPKITEQFGPQPDSVLRFVRLRLANNQPIGIHDNYIPGRLADRLRLTEERLRSESDLSFYDELERNGVRIAFAEQSIGAAAADRFQAQQLEIEPGAPLITFHRRTFSRERQLLEIMSSVYIAGKYEYTITLQRQGSVDALGR